jgi:small-conductance mechanosensitive channel
MFDPRNPYRPPPTDSQPTQSDVHRRLWVFAVLGALVVAGHVIVGYRATGSPATEAFVVAGMIAIIALVLRRAYRSALWRS